MRNFIPARLNSSRFSFERIMAAISRRIMELPHVFAWHFSPLISVENSNRLRSYYQMHLGERCIIIGNGPSLKRTDLSLLKDEITFGMNRIYLLFDQTSFIPSYYVAINELVLRQFSEDIDNLKMPKFLNWNQRYLFDNSSSNTAFLKLSFGFVDTFTKDITKPIMGGGTVTYVALQIAYYMGFQEVILIGVDHNFVDKGIPNEAVERQKEIDENHFHPQYFPKGVKWQLPDLRRSELAYEQARQAFERDGRRILDATIGGKCHVFEKVKYRSLFS